MITHKSIGYSGRLGNQMFQYAALKAISLETGFDYYLPDHLKIKSDGLFDFTSNKWVEYRLDLFDCFEINCPVIDKQLNSIYNEQNFTFEKEIFSISDNTAIEGYFQSYKYFEKYEDIIKKEFTFKKHILDKAKQILNQYENTVSINVRRGDYVTNPNYWNITPEYINEALQNFTDKEYTFLITSDDIPWCKEVFPEGVMFMENNTPFEDLCIMSLCDHNIIANSTFGWWAAWLNNNPDKKVVAPTNWFIPAKPLDDLYPKNWIKI
jgi:hypothetical protein